MPETPVVRCSCGKPARHTSICRDIGTPPGLPVDDVERVPADWEETRARRREEKFSKVRRDLDANRRMQRSQMTAIELHRLAIERQTTLSTVPAGPVGQSSPNSERQSPGPPTQQLQDDDPRWREVGYVIRRRLEDWHRLLDEAEGLGPSAVSTLDGDDKDKLILSQGRGHSCDAVVDVLGREVAGSARTVFRVRKKAGVSTLTGEPIENIGSIANRPGVRRVSV